MPIGQAERPEPTTDDRTTAGTRATTLLPERLNTGRLILRPYCHEDIAGVVEGCSDPVTQRFLTMLPSPYDEAAARQFIDESCPTAVAAGGRNWAGIDRASGRIALGIGLRPPTRFGVLEAGYWVTPAARSRGLAAEALAAVTTAGFAAGAPRIELVTDIENPASQRVAAKAGYQREGVQRGAITDRHGRRHDMVLWARLPDDPPGPAARRLPTVTTLEGDLGVRLRPVRAADAEALLSAFCPDRRARELPYDPWPAERVDAWCRIAAGEWVADQEARLAITVEAAEDQAIGLIRVRPLYVGDTAELGWALTEAWRGRGLATAAVGATVGWAMTEAGFERLEAHVNIDNHPSHRVAVAVGFRQEGIRRGLYPSQNGRRDGVVYGMVRADRT